MSATLDTVRRLIGRRSKISRQEMADIIIALDLHPAASTIAGRDQQGRLIIGSGGHGEWEAVEDSAAEPAALARAWANMCSGICCISVCRGTYYSDADTESCVEGLTVRYDQPGSMHPMQRAEIMFCPAELGCHEYDQIGQMRRRAVRVLVVRDDQRLVESSGADIARPSNR